MSRRQRVTIVAAGLGMFMVFLDALIVNVALPEIQDAFDVGEAGAQAVVTSYLVGMAVTIMWSATLADLRGRRWVYVIAAVVFVASSVLSGLAPSFPVLVIGRTLQGLAAGPIAARRDRRDHPGSGRSQRIRRRDRPAPTTAPGRPVP